MAPGQETAPSARPADGETAGVIAWPPLLFLVSVAVGLALHWIAPIALAPPWPARIVGALLCAMAGAVALSGERAMHARGTNVHPSKPTTAIVTSGPFRFSRNPLYLSLCLLHLGIGLLVDALWPVVMTAVLFGVLWWGVVAREERYLERRFGDEYRQYRRRVRRWL